VNVLEACSLPAADRSVHSVQDMLGNGDIGRYFLVPGSSGRAKAIADEFLTDVTSKDGERGHTLHLGKLDGTIDVGVVSTGMGCPRCVVCLCRKVQCNIKASHSPRVSVLPAWTSLSQS